MISIELFAFATLLSAPRVDDPCEVARRWLLPVIARGGDVDLDGANEFMVADVASATTRRCPTEHVGRAWVVSGASAQILLELRDDESGAGFGTAACGLGDVDGDRRADWVVSAPGSEARPYGRAIVFSGATGAKLFEVASTRSDDDFGAALCDIGDLDGDSIDDFAVGAQRSDHGSVGAGSVSFYSGRDGHPLGESACRGDDGGCPMCLDPLPGFAEDGSSVLAVGHRSRGWTFEPGINVITSPVQVLTALAAPIHESLARNRGALLIQSGGCRATNELWCIGDSWIERHSLASSTSGPRIEFNDVIGEDSLQASPISDWADLGDVNGDGVDDVAIGFDQTGVGEGLVRVVSGLDGRTLYYENGDWSLWHFGARVVALGDIDGDHIGDFAVGCDHRMSHEPGEVRVFSGRIGRMIRRLRLDRGELVVAK